MALPRITLPAFGRRTSADAALGWLLVGLSAAVVYLCWPWWPALLLAAWTAGLAQPLLCRLERALKGRRRAAAALSLLLFIGVLMPLGLVALGVVEGVRELWQVLAGTTSAKSALEAIAAGGAAGPSLGVPTSVATGLELIERYGVQGVKVLTGVAGAAARGVVGFFLYLGGTYVFMADGARAWAWLQRHAPMAPRPLERLAAAFHETGRGLFVGFGLTMATQGLCATLVYLSLGVPRFWVLGPLTGLAAVVPLAGTAVVWVPISVGLALTGHPVKAVVLVALGLGVIGSIDNVLRPFFARVGALRLPTFALYVAAFGGLAVMGPWGALLGPLLARLWVETLELRREEAAEAPAGGAQPPPP